MKRPDVAELDLALAARPTASGSTISAYVHVIRGVGRENGAR